MHTAALSRRSFLAASSALAAVPFVRTSRAAEPSQKVRLAVIGVAARGSHNLAGVAGEEIVALCDVDEPRADSARKQFPKAAFFTDYRKLFDTVANQIDGVVISTPDHSHCLPALLAMAQKKHVYCEKPLAHSVDEVRRMRSAAARSGVITQMGTQIHAGDNYRRVVEIVKGGKLGSVNRVHVWCQRKPDAMKRIPAPPAGVKFNPDLWVGPAPLDFFYASGPSKNAWPHFDWRWWWEWGGGVLADMGCHFMDLAFWALDLGAPTKVKATGTTIPNSDNTVPNTLQVDYAIPANGSRPAVHLTWYSGVQGPDIDGKVMFPGYTDGVLFEGDKGKLVSNYSKYQLFPDEFAKDFSAPPATIPNSIGHHREWLEAIRGNGKPLCEFGYAGTLAETVLLGNVAYRAGTEIVWDEATGKVTNAANANQFVGRPIRKGWDLPAV